MIGHALHRIDRPARHALAEQPLDQAAFGEREHAREADEQQEERDADDQHEHARRHRQPVTVSVK